MINTTFKRYVPQTRDKWKLYSKVFFPLILSATFFAFNGIVDNFMVGGITKGQASLGVANSWTNIIQSWFIACSVASIPLVNQFYRVNKHKQVLNSSKYQFVLCLIPTIVLLMFTFMAPNILIHSFYHQNDPIMMENIKSYMHVVSGRWVIMIFTFNLGAMLNALGYGFYNMIVNIFVILTNVSLNALLMYYFNLGIAGAAWASDASSVVSLIMFLVIIVVKKIKVLFNPFKILAYGSVARKQFWRRWVVVMSSFIQALLIIYRTSLYSAGYPDDSIGIGLSGLSVVSLTGALMSVFTTGYSAVGTLAATFVGTELAKNNMESAKREGEQVKGFTFLMAWIFAFALFSFAFAVPYMRFLSQDKFEAGKLIYDGKENLDQVFKSILIMAFIYPFWILLNANASIANSGGNGWRLGIASFVTQLIAIGWLAIIMFLIVPRSNYIAQNFWAMYSIFFIIDLLKIVLYEILYRKYDWLHSLVKEEERDSKNLKTKRIFKK